MGSKHNPPRWWRDFERECMAHEREKAKAAIERWKSDPFHIEILPAPIGQEQITWQSWEEVGAQCYTLDQQPITPNMVTYPGMEILAPSLFGYYKAKILDDTTAESESGDTLFMLSHDPIRGLVSSSSINKRAIVRLELDHGS